MGTVWRVTVELQQDVWDPVPEKGRPGQAGAAVRVGGGSHPRFVLSEAQEREGIRWECGASFVRC